MYYSIAHYTQNLLPFFRHTRTVDHMFTFLREETKAYPGL